MQDEFSCGHRSQIQVWQYCWRIYDQLLLINTSLDGVPYRDPEVCEPQYHGNIRFRWNPTACRLCQQYIFRNHVSTSNEVQSSRY